MFSLSIVLFFALVQNSLIYSFILTIDLTFKSNTKCKTLSIEKNGTSEEMNINDYSYISTTDVKVGYFYTFTLESYYILFQNALHRTGTTIPI